MSLWDRREIGGAGPRGDFPACGSVGGDNVAWIVKLVSIGAAGDERSTEVMRIARPDDLTDLATLGLTMAKGKQLLAGVQQELVAAQARRHAVRRPACRSCSTTCRVKDYRQHAIATLFGQVALRLPRCCCVGCGVTEAGLGWPSHIRSTPELDRLRAQLAALMPYRTAAEVLGQVFPVDTGADPETLRRHTFKIAEALSAQVRMKPPPTGAEAIVVTLDSTFIRSCEAGERQLEVRIGNVETASGGRQVFGAVAKTDTDLAGLIRHSLNAVGRTEGTALAAFTDGCPGLRRILLDAGVAGLPILDWFHIAMRLQHLTQIAGGLSSDGPERAAAKAVIVEEVERLRWRLWNGKAKDAKVSIERIRAVKHHFRGEPGSPPIHRALAQAMDRAAGAGRLPRRAERPADRLWRTAPGRAGGWHGVGRGNSQLPRQSAHEQIAGDALVGARCRSAAPSPLRRLQRHVRRQLRAALPSRPRSASASSHRGMTPNLATVPL